jgi:type IV pilus assembly protein PilM
VAKTRVIGLDIGTTHVRAAELEFRGRGRVGTTTPTVVRVGQVELPRDAVRDGEVAEPETVATAIRQLWSQSKFSHKDVVIGIGNQRVLVRDLELPWMPPAQIRASLPFQVADLLPVAVEDALLDYVATGSRPGDQGEVLQGLLVAATKETVLANTTAVEAAGLRPVMVDLNAFALARVMARGDAATRTVALLDVGARVTTLVVVADGTPQFVRILPMGGHDVTDSVAIGLGISRGEAEGVKRGSGPGRDDPAREAAVAERVIASTTALVEAVRNTLIYYASTHPGAAAERVVLTGGGAELSGFVTHLDGAIRVPVVLGHPLSTLTVTDGGVPSDVLAAQHALAVPLGLAFGEAA